MAWRDATDPACPECGEPIGATATYCMHCGTDLAMDDSADVSDADDVTMAELSGTERGTESQSLGDRLRSLFAFNKTARPGQADVTETTPPERESAPSATEHRSASLALRLPTAIFVSIPVPFLAILIVGSVVQSLPGGVVLLVLGGSWFGSIAWLSRRPLPSEVVGDALYLIAGLLLVGPVVNQTDLFLRRLIAPASVGASLWDILLGLIAYEMLVLFPVAILLLAGYGGNAWAARKLDPDPDSAEVEGDPGHDGAIE